MKFDLLKQLDREKILNEVLAGATVLVHPVRAPHPVHIKSRKRRKEGEEEGKAEERREGLASGRANLNLKG